ncbi:general transcription factor 3C polypeptide 3 [Pelomyxa schiedti]|nr:general transcription factor 3C polypeptide 3 [Pelomyxa schiedti]
MSASASDDEESAELPSSSEYEEDSASGSESEESGESDCGSENASESESESDGGKETVNAVKPENKQQQQQRQQQQRAVGKQTRANKINALVFSVKAAASLTEARGRNVDGESNSTTNSMALGTSLGDLNAQSAALQAVGSNEDSFDGTLPLVEVDEAAMAAKYAPKLSGTGVLTTPKKLPSLNRMSTTPTQKSQSPSCRPSSAKTCGTVSAKNSSQSDSEEDATMCDPEDDPEAHKKRQKIKLPHAVRQLVGEAHLLFIDGKHEKALELLHEAVRLAPTCPQLYNTMGCIFEKMKIPQKALDAFMIAAHMMPKDIELWKRLMEMARDLGNKPLLLYCMTKAVAAKPQDFQMVYDRARLLLESGLTDKAISGFRDALALDPTKSEVAIRLAQVFHKEKRIPDAIATLSKHLQTPEDSNKELNMLNMLSELYMAQGEYEKAYNMIHQRYIKVGAELPIQLLVNLGLCKIYMGSITEAVAILDSLHRYSVTENSDLYYCIAEAFMKIGEPEHALGWYHALERNPNLPKNILWVKQAQCLTAASRRQEAITLYEKVVEQYPLLPEPVLALAQQHIENGNFTAAIEVFDNFLRNASKSPNEGDIIRVQVHKGLALFENKQYQEFVQICLPLLRNSLEILNHEVALEKRKKRRTLVRTRRGQRSRREKTKTEPSESFLFVLHKKKKSKKVKAPSSVPSQQVFDSPVPPPPLTTLPTKAITLGPGTPLPTSSLIEATSLTNAQPEIPKQVSTSTIASVTLSAANTTTTSTMESKPTRRKRCKGTKIMQHNLFLEEVGKDAFFDIALKLAKVLVILEESHQAIKLLSDVLKVALLSRAEVYEMRLLLVGIRYNLGDNKGALKSLRPVCLANPNNKSVWNLYTKIVAEGGPEGWKEVNRFIVRSAILHPTSVPLMLLVGHLCLSTAFYGLALAEYLTAYKFFSEEPIINLCIGVTLLHRVMNRCNPNRHYMCIQAFSFLYQYYRLKKGNQEACYNLGRAHHHLGIHHLALHFYEKALEQSSDDPDNDLTKEIAFNIVRILKDTGNHHLARLYTQNYLSF